MNICVIKMAERFYFDTSIWLDIYEKRDYNGEVALKLIKKIIEEDSKILYSDIHVIELKNLGYSFNDINKIFKIAKPNNILRVHIYEEQKEEAKRISLTRNVPKRDALHSILARDNEAQLITRDNHFQKIVDITKPQKPEEII